MSSVDPAVLTDLTGLMNSLSVNIDASSNLAEIFEKLHDMVTNADVRQINETVNDAVLESLIKAVGAVPASDKITLLNCDDIFESVLRSIPIHDLFQRFTPQFILALNSKSMAVKNRFLMTMRRALEEDESVLSEMLAGGSPILISVCRCLTDSDSDVSSEAQCFLTLVGKHPLGSQLLFKQNDLVILALREMLSMGEIIRFRVYELVSNWSQISAPLLEECAKADLISRLLNELSLDDILVKMNALEILTSMCIGAPHCLKFFYDNGILVRLYELFQLSESSPDANFLFPAVMKFFGHIARMHPSQCDQQFPAFYVAVFHMVLNYRLLEVGQRLLAFDTLALIASTSDGKAVLAKYGNDMQICMKSFGQCIREGPMDMRIRHLDALNDVISLEDSKLNDPTFLSLTEKWFDGLKAGIGSSNDPALFLFDVLKQPIQEVRTPLTKIFKSLLAQNWAQDRILKLAGFVEYITSPLDCRDSRHNAFRHEVAGLLLKSDFCASKLDADSTARLRAFFDRGPFYKGDAQVAVGMESA